MIDHSNPVQVAWLNKMNAELGNLVSSNCALVVQIEHAGLLAIKSAEEFKTAQQQIADMGLSNAALREENQLLKTRKK